MNHKTLIKTLPFLLAFLASTSVFAEKINCDFLTGYSNENLLILSLEENNNMVYLASRERGILKGSKVNLFRAIKYGRKATLIKNMGNTTNLTLFRNLSYNPFGRLVKRGDLIINITVEGSFFGKYITAECK